MKQKFALLTLGIVSLVAVTGLILAQGIAGYGFFHLPMRSSEAVLLPPHCPGNAMLCPTPSCAKMGRDILVYRADRSTYELRLPKLIENRRVGGCCAEETLLRIAVPDGFGCMTDLSLLCSAGRWTELESVETCE